jgi:nucleoside-diphosphate-sugar epimerase
MRVLVTGGSGFTGSHLCKRLVKEGYRVKTITRNPEKANHLRELGVEIIFGDIVKFKTALRATKNVDRVYHLAALYRQEGIPRSAFWDVNVEGTENVLKASVHHGVQRFIHCSTVGVHGEIDHPPANEDAPYGPGDHYQESKMAGEKVVIQYMRRGEPAITIFRPAGIYGPGDLRFLKLFRAIHRGTFWMIGTGHILYHLTYIDDLIDGILLCGDKQEAIGRIYILAGSEYVTLNLLVSQIAEVLDVRLSQRRIPVWPVYSLSYLCQLICKPLRIEPPLYPRRVDFFRKSRAFDITRARKEIGFCPNVDLKTGLKKTAQWYQKDGWL